MRIILSAAISADGYLDDNSDNRLILSSPEDWRAVYALRAECDAVLVGAGTIRDDNPSLVIRDPELRRKREAEGRPADIIKVAVSGSGRLDPTSRFFTEGGGEKIVFTKGEVSSALADVATVISRPELTAITIVRELHKMGVETLLVEGGSKILSMFLRDMRWDEFRLAVAPILVGNTDAPRLVADGVYPPMTLTKVEQFGQTAVMHFVNRSQYRVDCGFIIRAMDNSLKSEPCPTCYAVGAVVVTKNKHVYDGYTHETGGANHAEEEAIAKALASGEDLAGATIYSTIEPCSVRGSKSESCSELIIRHGFTRVVYVMREPGKFADCTGFEMLIAAGIDVVEIPSFSPEVKSINRHVIGGK